MEMWPAPHNLSIVELLQQHSAMVLILGCDDDDRAIGMRLDRYVEYAARQKDDVPLYLFDNFDDSALNEPARCYRLLRRTVLPKRLLVNRRRVAPAVPLAAHWH